MLGVAVKEAVAQRLDGGRGRGFRLGLLGGFAGNTKRICGAYESIAPYARGVGNVISIECGYINAYLRAKVGRCQPLKCFSLAVSEFLPIDNVDVEDRATFNVFLVEIEPDHTCCRAILFVCEIAVLNVRGDDRPISQKKWRYLPASALDHICDLQTFRRGDARLQIIDRRGRGFRLGAFNPLGLRDREELVIGRAGRVIATQLTIENRRTGAVGFHFCGDVIPRLVGVMTAHDQAGLECLERHGLVASSNSGLDVLARCLAVALNPVAPFLFLGVGSGFACGFNFAGARIAFNGPRMVIRYGFWTAVAADHRRRAGDLNAQRTFLPVHDAVNARRHAAKTGNALIDLVAYDCFPTAIVPLFTINEACFWFLDRRRRAAGHVDAGHGLGRCLRLASDVLDQRLEHAQRPLAAHFAHIGAQRL